MTEKIPCSEQVYGGGTWGAFHPHHCEKAAIVERHGQHFCKIHDPEYIKNKNEAKRKLWEAQYARESKDADRKLLIARAFEGLTLEKIQERKAAGQCPCCGR